MFWWVLPNYFADRRPDYIRVVQLLRSNMEEIEVEDEATCPAVEWVEQALKGITIKIIRGRLISTNLSGWAANTENTTPRVLCVRVALAIQRLPKTGSRPPRGPCSTNVDSPGAKVVAPLTLPGLVVLLSIRYLFPLGSTERSDEIVAIFKPTQQHNQFIDILSILWVVGLLAHPASRLLIFVNTSQFRIDERHVAALSAVGQTPAVSIGSSTPSMSIRPMSSSSRWTSTRSAWAASSLCWRRSLGSSVKRARLL